MLVGDGIRLRSPERADLAAFVRWFNSPEIRSFLARSTPMSLAEEERWFEHYLGDDDLRLFCIEVVERNRWRLVGNCGLSRLNWVDRKAMVGICIGEPSVWGQGYGTAAMRLLCAHAFDDLNLHRIELHVFDDNPRAVRCYEKVGFQLEGRRRDAVFKAGCYRDVLVMGLLATELRRG